MPRKYFRKFLPSHAAIHESRWLRPFSAMLRHPNLWHLHRRSVSGGVAVGMLCGLVPGPLQMLSAALLAMLFRVNLPVAMFVTLYTNPLTIVPLYWLAYQLGVFVTGAQDSLSLLHFSVPEMTWDNWFAVMVDWIISLGKPFAIGLPLLAVLLAAVSYVLVRLGWRMWVIWHWHKRKRR